MLKKKVLHILNTGSYSGAENVVITIIKNTKNDVDSVYLSLDGSIRDILQENDIAFYPVSKLSVVNIKKAIRDLRPDIIHAHDFTAGIIAALSAGRIPIINHLHNNSPWIKKLGVRSIAYGVSCLRYQKILTVSSSVMDEYIFGSFFESKSQVVGNPIDIDAIRMKLQEGEADSIPCADIQYLGRLTQQKNPLFFLEIIAELKKGIPSLAVSMVGEGEMRPQIEKKIADLDLQKTVTLYGFQSNPYLYLAKSKVLCMPSLWEGFGLVAVEALAFGKPVIASPVGGLPGIVNDACGSLCESKEEFVEVLKQYLSDEPFLEKKSEGALLRAECLDNIKDYINQLLALYV